MSRYSFHSELTSFYHYRILSPSTVNVVLPLLGAPPVHLTSVYHYPILFPFTFYIILPLPDTLSSHILHCVTITRYSFHAQLTSFLQLQCSSHPQFSRYYYPILFPFTFYIVLPLPDTLSSHSNIVTPLTSFYRYPIPFPFKCYIVSPLPGTPSMHT